MKGGLQRLRRESPITYTVLVLAMGDSHLTDSRALVLEISEQDFFGEDGGGEIISLHISINFFSFR